MSPAPLYAQASVPADPRCGEIAAFQVLLDRQGFSPGEIDGRAGQHLSRALGAFQEAKQIAVTSAPNCETWQALGGESTPFLADYVVTDADVKGPFVPKIPADLVQQASLPSLGYRSPLEAIAERFHASPTFIEQLNKGTPIAAGAMLRVPAVEPFDAGAKPTPNADAGAISIEISREPSVMRATRADGTLVFYAPVSSGSEHDPLPPGSWKVTGVSWLPPFNYNPDLFWDAKPSQERATLKPGPNNPVGVVWIDVNIEHYGIHGTPEPSRIGRTESHGCVRLTNWDAAKLASLVAAGSPVIFK
jgi:lipoprotein-anchoring transpeptidase ErfK/SrfK